MKLKRKLLLLSIVPLILLSGITAIVTFLITKNLIQEEAATSLHATAVSVQDTYGLGKPGRYVRYDSGEVWKGSFVNVSAETSIVDGIKSASDVDVTFIFDNESVMTSIVDKDGNRMVGTTVDDKVYQNVIVNKQAYFDDEANIGGVNYYAYYLPVYQEKSDTEVIGMIFVGKKQANVEEGLKHLMNVIFSIMVGVLILFAIITLIVANKITSALKEGVSVIEDVSTGNLTTSVSAAFEKRRDELGDMCRAITRLRYELERIISGIRSDSMVLLNSAFSLDTAAAQTASAVGQVELAVNDIAHGATSQAEETQNATNHISQMGKMIEETVTEVNGLQMTSSGMGKSSKEAAKILSELRVINKNASQAIDIIYNQTYTTNESAQKISDAISIITAIAEETNLLSLNASIEAARAGEFGRGFAVVAERIKKLAEQSNQSAKNIYEIANSLMKDSDNAVVTMREVKTIMEHQSENVVRTEEIFSVVIEGIGESLAGVDKIDERSKQLDVTRENVVDGVTNLAAIAEENSASTQETTAAIIEVLNMVANVSESAKHLKLIANRLEENVNIFKLKNENAEKDNQAQQKDIL